MSQLIQRLQAGGIRTAAALLVVVLLVTGGALTLRAQNDDNVVALVNGQAITKAELFDEMYKYVGAQVLDEMILLRLLHMEAEERGVSVSEEQVDKEIAAIAEQVGGREQLDFLLFQQQMTMDELVSQIRNNLLITALIGPEVVIDDEEVRQIFEDNKEFFAEEEQVRARHILVDTQELADEIRQQLVDGEDFADLAREHSTDAGSGARGGDLGWFGRGVMVAPFEEAAFALEIGDISPVIESPFGFHIIRVDERSEAKAAEFDDEIAAFIREQIIEDEVQQRLPSWLNNLRSGADVEILLGK